MFTNRSDAAQQLVAALRRRNVGGDVVVAVAPGGIPIGNVVASEQGLPLDVVVAQRLRAPAHPELTIGAVAPGGYSWVNSPLMRFLDVDWEYVQRAKAHASEVVETRAVEYGAAWGPLDVDGKRVVLVDDGIPTGATMRVCIQRLIDEGATGVVAAAPVGPPDVLEKVARWADDVVVPLRPAAFQATGDYYEEFSRVTDAEATTVLPRVVRERTA